MRIALAALLLFASAFAQASVEEELAQDHLRIMERYLKVLSGVKDVASAKQAQAELSALSERNMDLFRKAKGLNISNQAMIDYVQKHHKARGEAIFKGIFSNMVGMSKVPEFEQIGDYISKPVNELSNTTWASISGKF